MASTQKVTLITGCSSGIGLSIAVRLAQLPGKPYLVYATMRNLFKKGDLEKAAGSALNDTLFVEQLDITKDDQIFSVAKKLSDKHGRIDVLVNNAAFGQMKVFEELSLEEMRGIIDTNITGTFRMTQAVIPGMKAQKSGRIINISSMIAVMPLPFFNVYAATKYAVEGMTESLYPELGHFNVWISSVLPGPVVTKFGDNMVVNRGDAPVTDDPESPSAKMMTTFLQKMMTDMQSVFQTPEDVSDIVEKCLNSDKPLLRYGTSDYVNDGIKDRFGDIVGAKPCDQLVKLIESLS